MTDKVQKIKDWICKEQDGLMDAQGNFEYSEHEGAYHILCNLDAYIDSLQEEPAPKIFEDMLNAKIPAESLGISAEEHDKIIDLCLYGKEPEMVDIDDLPKEEPVSEELEEAAKNHAVERYRATRDMVLAEKCKWSFKAGAEWQKTKDESTTEDLGEYISELSKQFPEVSFAKLSRIAVRVAKWQKENLWKHADGDDLPEISREVVAFQEIFPTNVDVPSLFKIVVTHRPNPEGYDGKSIVTGEVEHYTPKTYDKGGWNIPDIVCWLDVELPKEIEP